MTDPSSNTDFMAGYSGITRPNVAGSGLPHRTVLNSPPPPGRLTSLRSRDLTLGGFKKKTFVPNVHSLRKSKDELKEEAHVAPKKDRRVREERPKERRERTPQIIQSHSIFEQGPADTVKKPGGWRGTDLTDSRSSPVAKCFKKERRASEENDMLHKLQRDDFLDDPGLKNDAKNKPIQLPLYQSSNFLTTEATTPSFRAPATTNPNLPLQYGAGHQYGPGQIPQYGPGQIPQYGPGPIPQYGPGQIPQYRPDQIPQYGPGQIPQYRPDQIPQYGPDQIPQYGPGQGVLCPDQIPQYGPDQIPQYRPGQGVLCPDQIPQYGPDQIPQYRPDQIPQYGPGQIPQYRPGQGVLSPDQPSVAELFHQLMVSETEELLFIQLPDTIPGQPTTASVQSQPATATSQPITAPERNGKKDSKSDGKRTSHIKAPDTAGKDVPVLSEFTEGFLGKLQIRKSGKVQLVLGDITMDVSEGAAFSFLQQLVSVRLSEGLTGDMSILGNVKHKLVCSPDFQALLQEPSPDHSAHL
ncbi:DNA-directed RNA polymerase III subunit RPC4 [Oncorhynchus nerka]|uniref:DNA-directed RNA polymerase III subunit RPC4 n=1 Tax=Oncorhynchus nerka TaxID=8023 RepID=UPI0031B85AB5